MNNIIAHFAADEVVNTEQELSSFVRSELSNKFSLLTFTDSKNFSGDMHVGDAKYRLFSYGKAYTGGERVEEFFKAFFLTLFTVGLALLDARVRTSFDAAVNGYSIKKAAISYSITTESIVKYMAKSFLSDPLATINSALKFGTSVLNSPGAVAAV